MLLVVSCLSSQAQSFNPKLFKSFIAKKKSGGSESGGGGDIQTEKKIKSIRDDILHWIKQGGAKDLNFSKTITYEDYLNGNKNKQIYAMSDVLKDGAVTIVAFERSEENLSDIFLNTYVNGSPKICKGFISNYAYIICNKEKFLDLTNEEQYQQVHHEYAGLARLEQNYAADSDYSLSKQITAYIEYKLIPKLVVKKRTPTLKTEPGTLIELVYRYNKIDKKIKNTKKRRARKKLKKIHKKEMHKMQQEILKRVNESLSQTRYGMSCKEDLGYTSKGISSERVIDLSMKAIHEDVLSELSIEDHMMEPKKRPGYIFLRFIIRKHYSNFEAQNYFFTISMQEDQTSLKIIDHRLHILSHLNNGNGEQYHCFHYKY